jgi:hypothetical protein
MVESGEVWLIVVEKVTVMAEQLQTLSDLAKEINYTLVKVGRASWRREFNSRLWACNRERALALIAEYREFLSKLMVEGVSGDLASHPMTMK